MKKLLTLLLALTTFTAIQAQNDEVPNSSSKKKFVNMNLSGMVGSASFKHTVNGNGYKFSDINLQGGSAELEWVLRGMRYQIELDYQTGDMTDDITTKQEGKPAFAYDEAKYAKNLKAITGMFYIGGTMLPCKRFQIPIYAGFGGESIQGYPCENFSFCFGFKARAVLYLTKNIGLFAGYRYKMSAVEKSKTELEGLSDSDKLEFVNNYHFAEAGLTIMLGRMGGNKQ